MNEKKYLFEVMSRSLVEQDRERASSLAEKFEGDLAKSLDVALGKNYADENPTVALELAASLSKDSRQEVAKYAVERLVKNEPSTAIEFVRENPDSVFSGDILTLISRELSRKNPIKAAEWYANDFANNGTDKYYGTDVSFGIFSVDQEEGVRFLNDLEPSMNRDGIIRNVLNNNYVRDFEESFYLARSMGSESMRTRQLKKTFKAWYKSNPEDALQGLIHSGLPEGERANLRSLFLPKNKNN